MKSLKQLAMSFSITLILSTSILAGDIDIGKASATSPPPSDTTPGDIQMPGVTSPPVSEVALNLLQTVLSIL